MNSDANKTKSYDKDIESINKALDQVRFCERYLVEIKTRMDKLVQFIGEAALRNNFKFIRNNKAELNPVTLINKLEQTVQKEILPRINISSLSQKSTIYKSFQQKQILQQSKSIFKEELSIIPKYSRNLQNHREFKEVFSTPEKGMFQVSYNLLQLMFKQILKQDYIFIYYQKTDKFEDLPDTFYISILKFNLMVTTLTFRKLKNTEQEIKNQVVGIFNLSYSNLFDTGEKQFNSDQPLPLIFQYKDPNDPQFKNIMHILRRHRKRINLPCLYPTLKINQHFSYYLMDKIESIWSMSTDQEIKENFTKADVTQLKENVIKDLDIRLEQILKNYPDSFIEYMGANCFLCNKKFAVDPQFQQYMPAVMGKKVNQTRVAPVHIACKAIHNSFLNFIGCNEPPLTIEFDASEVHSDF